MTNPTPKPIRPDDALKYVAALLKSRLEWTTDAIAGSMCDLSHEIELDAIDDTMREVLLLAAQFGNPRRYSDGRRVQSSAEIQCGLTTHHVWHPDPTAEQPTSWRGSLPSDPDEPSPGIYEVSLEPMAQDIHVRIVRVV